MELTVGISFDLKKNYPKEMKSSSDADCELDSMETIDAIAAALEKNGNRVIKLGNAREVIKSIEKAKPDIVFNISEGIWGRNREAQIPAILEAYQIPYTGSDPLTLSLCLDKSMSKKIISYNNIPTPDFKKIEEAEEIQKLHEMKIDFPLFIKPCYEGSSKGIRMDSKIKNISALKKKTFELLATYRQPVLIEEYLPGSEYTVGILGTKEPEVLGIMEVKSISQSE